MFQNLLREISYVPRWGIFRRTRNQSVAEHSYYVGLYAGQLADYLQWRGDKYRLMMCAAVHDLFEGRSGDIPAPFKRQMSMGERYEAAELEYFHENFPDLVKYLMELRKNPHISVMVKVADRLEGCLFLATEFMSGNRYAGRHTERGSPAYDMFLGLDKALGELGREMFLQVSETLALRSLIDRAIEETETTMPRILMASKL